MAQLQYIGARYVPKFYENSLDPSSADWEPGIGYEPLTVVTYNDDTYTSKIPVPSTVGAPDSEPIYWAKTGDYNAAITALQNAVSSLQNDVGDIQNDIDDIHKAPSKMLYQLPTYPFDVACYDFPDNVTNNIQGGCILPDGRIVQYFRSTDDSQGILALFYNTGVYIDQINANIGHCNDMCWSPTLNRLVCIGTSNTLELYTIIGNVIAHDSSISVDAAYNVHGIVELDGVFYIYAGISTTLWKTTDFVTFEVVSTNFAILGGLNEYYHQGIATDGEYIYWLGAYRGLSLSIVLAYDLDGNYKDGLCYSLGWGEVEWIDFFDGKMYSASKDKDIITNGCALIRRDLYRNHDKGYPEPLIPTGGKTSPLYLYLDSTYSGAFANGYSATYPFKHGTLLCKCTSGMSNVCIRCTANNDEIILNEIDCQIRDNTTASTVTLRRCKIINRNTLTSANQITIQRCLYIGDITADIALDRSVLIGAITGTVTGNNNVITGAISGTNNITP